MAFIANSGSAYGSDASIPDSINNWTQLYIVGDAGAAGSANIQCGAVAASTVAILRAPAGGMSPLITIIRSTCLSINGLSNGDVIALIKV